MSSVHPEYDTSPSWVPPIMLGALVTLLSQFVTLSLGEAASMCCCGAALPLGVLASWLAYRRDPAFTPGQGFTVAFIACGLGSAVTAFIAIMQMGPEVRGEMMDAVRQSLEQYNREAAADQKLSPEQVDRATEAAGAIAPYVPAVGALVCTLLSAVSGLVAVLLLRIRRPRPPIPGGVQ